MSDSSHKERKERKERKGAEERVDCLSQRCKTSDVAWFGDAPEGWVVKRLASYFVERRVKVSDKDYPPLSVTRNGIMPQLENVAKTNDGDNRKLVRKGDFVINSRSDRKGSSGVSDYDGSVSLINLVLQPRGGLYGAYCNYLLKSLSFVEENYRNGRGIVADLWTTRYDEMKMIKVAMPPLAEQEAIVAYLDAETGRIDKAIAAEEKMIALLQERREIMINEAVTPHDGWEMKPLRSFLCEVRELSKTGEELPLSLTANAGIVPFSEKSNRTLENDTYVGTKIVRKGQIVFNRFRARLFAVSGYDGLVSPDYAVFTVSKDVAAKFLVALFGTSRFKQRLNLLASGIGDGFSRVYAGDLLRLKISLPPLPEQKAIVERLDRETGKIDRVIEVKRRQIELLRERRQIVIDEVVTGKVKVA